MKPIDEILHGDCLNLLHEIPSDFVDLVYMDPPFFTQTTQSLKAKDNTEYRFQDKWPSMSAYLDFLRVRLIEMRRVMTDRATLFVHCDRNASHYIKVLLDEVFGYDRFLSEIIWTYKRWSNSKKNLLPTHQTIFMYSKSAEYTFNILFQDYSETTNLDQILQKRERNEHGKAVYATDAQGDVILNGAKKGVPLSDTWDIPYLNPKARERTGYPTQKPLLLLERIIKIASHEGDVVLDPFCGSGTTCVAAKLLNRQYIGMDISQEAVALSQSRLQNPIRSDSPLLKKGRNAYHNLPDDVLAILKPLPVQLVQRNSGIDAIYHQFVDSKPVFIRVQRQGESLADAAKKLHQAGQKKKSDVLFLIQTAPHTQDAFMDVLPHTVIVVDALTLSIQSHIENLLPENG